MANKALDNARRLEVFSRDIAQVDDAVTALDRTQTDAATQTAPADGEASFGGAEGLLTGILASLVLGPVGGILVGGAYGLLKKKSEKDILSKLASEQTVLTKSANIRGEQLEAFRTSAVNPNDFEQIEVMQRKLDMANGFIEGGSPEEGALLMQDVDQGITAHARNQETDRVALESQVKSDKRQLGLDNYDRYNNMKTDFDNQSAGWLARKEGANIALASLQGGTAAQIHSAMIMFNKTLDPNSAVLGEERDSISGMGSALDTAYNFFGEKFTGQKLNAEQRTELGAAILTITDESTRFQAQREARFGARAIDDLAPQYIDRFTLIENTPGAEPLDIPPDAKKVVRDIPGMAAENAERLGQRIVEQANKEKEQFKKGIGAITDFVGNAVSAGSEAIQGANTAIEAGIETFQKDVKRGIPGTRRTN